jgi:small subunit ribosomal protein S4
MVTHGHIVVNGKCVDIPSALVKANDVVGIREKSRSSELFKAIAESGNKLSVPAWLSAGELGGTVTRFPNRDEIDVPVDEQAIVELYSR